MSEARPEPPARAVDGPALSVAAVARRLGVAPATLRTWDRRYGLGPSEHQAGSHRRYTGSDMARLLVMRRLTLDGVAPAEAARLALASDPGAATALGGAAAPPSIALESVGVPERAIWGAPLPVHRPAEPSPAVFDDHPSEATAAAARPESPALAEMVSAERLVRGLLRAANSLDGDECQRIIRRSIRHTGVVQTWQQLLVPAFLACSERWEATGEGIEVEHLLSESVLDVLREIAGRLAGPRNSRPIVLAAAEEEQHGLPLHVLAAALAEQALAVRMLGVRVPRRALAAAVRRLGPSVVVVYAHMPVEDPGQLADLPRLRPAPLLLLGGPGWRGVPVPASAEYTDDLQGAVARIEHALGL